MMKIINNGRLIAIALFTVFTAFSAPAALANNHESLPVELKFIGNTNHQSIFQLTVSDDSPDNDYTLIIRGPFGNTIFRENIKSGKFTKKFLFDTDELGDDELEFEVFSRNTNKSAKFVISRQTRFIEEMVVNAAK